MTAAVFGPYLETAVSNYARDNVESGRWPEKGALARSRADFDSLLPQGPKTPNNYLFEIKSAETGPTIGFLWSAAVAKGGLRSAFVYDIEIEPEYRRQGHAKAAFAALEQRVRELGLSRIGLHVFGRNPDAQALYASLGYRVTGINMLKNLDADSAR
jgi:ribosomal protein S18 acetylase RimI-like enzyme